MSHLRPHLRRDLVELVLRLPWWVSLLCAFSSYLLLHPLTALLAPAAAPQGMLDTAVIAIGQLLAGLAGVAQYLIPIAFLSLTAVTAFHNWKRYVLRWSLMTNQGGAGFRTLSHEDIELLVATAYRSQGFQVRKPEDRLYRRGFDLELTRDGERRLMHLRNWKSSSLGATPLEELHAEMQETCADGLSVLVSGRFSPDAQSFAADKPIELIDGRQLKALVLAQEQSSLVTLAAAFRLRIGAWHRTLNWLKQQNTTTTRTPRKDMFDDADDTERTLGIALGALIRKESRPGAIATWSRGKTVPEHPTPPPNATLATATIRPNRRIHTLTDIAPISIARIANAVGMALSLGLIWMTYQWFNALPAAPTDTPWSLLGQGRQQGSGRQSDSATGYASVKKDAPPLGQLDYGPDLALSPPTETEPAAVIVEQAPVEIFRSIRELEDAFNARYIPPPVCYDRHSPDSLARCGNHRIRSRRAFLASNGRTMVPEEPAQTQPVDPPGEPGDASWSSERPLSWETGPDWRQPPPPYPYEPEPIPDWRTNSALEPEPIPDWRYPPPPADPYERRLPPAQPEPIPDRYREWRHPQDARPYREWQREPDWTQPQTQDIYRQPPPQQRWGTVEDEYDRSGWQQPEWQSRVEPQPESPWPPDPAWWQDRGMVPRMQRQPVEEWLPRPPPGQEHTWRDEQQLLEQRFRQQNETWRRGAEATEYWDGMPDQDNLKEAIPDWRQDWVW